MAYAAVVSLKQTIGHLSILIGRPPQEYEQDESLTALSILGVLLIAKEVVTSLQKVLERLDDHNSVNSCDSERLDALDGQVRVAVCELEDLLEFHISNQFLSHSQNYGGEGFYHILYQEVLSFVETIQMIKEEYVEEIENPSLEKEDDDDEDEEDDDEAIFSSSIDFGVEMVGLLEKCTDVKKLVIASIRPYDFKVLSIVGMPGTGKTILARKIFEDLYVGKEQSLDYGAWVSVGPIYQLKEILIRIVSQIGPPDIDKLLVWGKEEKIAKYLYNRLKGKTYLIVLDDICDVQVWDYLRRSLPKQDNGSLAVLTTRLKEVAQIVDDYSSFYMPVLDETVSWSMIRMAMFGRRSCPQELEEAGKKIARNCQGLPIIIAKVILLLFKSQKTSEYWNGIAENAENSIFKITDEMSEMSEIKEDLELYELFPYDREIALATGIITSMLDHSDKIMGIKIDHLFPERLFPKMKIISVLGMTGIGKTTLVKKVFEDESIQHHFDHHVWVTLGQNYQPEEILVDVLAQICPDVDKVRMKQDAELTKELCIQLSNKRCLIVLDDMWNKEALHYLKISFPDIKGKVLVTTTLAKVAQFGNQDKVYHMGLLNKEESWCLFRQKVLGEESCPFELEKAGKRIVEKCEGLPLLILAVADILTKVEKSPEYWNKLAEDKQFSIFMNATNNISKKLLPRYKSLPQYLKECFLYMGVFDQKYGIRISKLIKLWIAEGFLEPEPSNTARCFAGECLSELADNGFITVRDNGFNLVVKTLGLHAVFWYLSNIEAGKSKTFHALNVYDDSSIEGLDRHRRFCIRNNILLSIKGVQNSVASISTVRSLLCFGQYHRYPVPICWGLRLLRVLDALTIRFYEFPVEVVKLIQLKYLALTCDGILPSSISKLRNLQYFIIKVHLSIKSARDLPYLPLEIWDMKELKHLQIMGSSGLQNPSIDQALLPNLLTLLDVSAHSCTKEVFERIPHLEKLGILIELTPDDDGNPFHCLNHISCLNRLESLKCVVVNHEFRSKVVAPLDHSMLLSCLRKLSLSGLRYPWEQMSIIGKLQNLEVLKLRSYAFQGPKWETERISFYKLKFLSIEDTDLMHWKLEMPCLPRLESLSIKHCYKLKKLPCAYFFVKRIEVVDCSSLAVTWAKQMEEKYLIERFTLDAPYKIHVHCSWDDGKLG